MALDPQVILTPWILILASPFIGSFLGVVAERLPAGQNPLTGRSHCPRCGAQLAALDLIPILSWVWLRGRCRTCHGAIGLFPLVMELAAMVVAVWTSLAVPGWLLWPSCALGWTLLTLSALDMRTLRLPDQLTLPLIPLGLIVTAVVDPGSLLDHGFGVLLGFGSLAGIAWLYHRLRNRDGLGMGDAKLLAAVGAWVSWQGLPSVVLLGAGSALAAVLARSAFGHTITRTDRLPFGPFLALGGWLVWLYGPLVAYIV